MVQWSTLCPRVCGRAPGLPAGLLPFLPVTCVGVDCRMPPPGRTAVRDGGTGATPLAYDEPPFRAATQGTCPAGHARLGQSRRSRTIQRSSPKNILVVLSKRKTCFLPAAPHPSDSLPGRRSPSMNPVHSVPGTRYSAAFAPTPRLIIYPVNTRSSHGSEEDPHAGRRLRRGL